MSLIFYHLCLVFLDYELRPNQERNKAFMIHNNSIFTFTLIFYSLMLYKGEWGPCIPLMPSSRLISYKKVRCYNTTNTFSLLCEWWEEIIRNVSELYPNKRNLFKAKLIHEKRKNGFFSFSYRRAALWTDEVHVYFVFITIIFRSSPCFVRIKNINALHETS